MTDRLEPAKGKTRDAHEREMKEVADALRRYLVRKKFMRDEPDASWTVDGALHVFSGRQIGGRVVDFMEAACCLPRYFLARPPRSIVRPPRRSLSLLDHLRHAGTLTESERPERSAHA